MNATQVRELAEAVCAIAHSTLDGLDVTPDNLRTFALDGTKNALILELTWVVADGDRGLRLGCPR